jgi:RHS repeat-associated protein
MRHPVWIVHQTRFIYDGNQVVLQFDKTGEGSLAASDLSHRYLWNPQAVDQLFADEQAHFDEEQGISVSDGVLWALTDHEQTVRDLAIYDFGTDATTIDNRRVYDAFGNLQDQTNAAVDCLFGYTGRPFDKASGEQYNGARWYEAVTGRWLSEDPSGFAGGDANLNRYCGNNPMNYRDPSGLASDPQYVAFDSSDGSQYVPYTDDGSNRGMTSDGYGYPVLTSDGVLWVDVCTMEFPSGTVHRVVRPIGAPRHPNWDWLDWAANIGAGWGDTVTIGATNRLRIWWGINGGIDQSSGAYGIGQGLGAVNNIALGTVSPCGPGWAGWAIRGINGGQAVGNGVSATDNLWRGD